MAEERAASLSAATCRRFGFPVPDGQGSYSDDEGRGDCLGGRSDCAAIALTKAGAAGAEAEADEGWSNSGGGGRCADEGRNDCADEGWSDRGEGGSHSGGGCRGCGGAAEIEVAVRLRCGGGGENEWWWVSAVFLRT